jgi:hypothetical protein
MTIEKLISGTELDIPIEAPRNKLKQENYKT